ncbi:hypothetical protein PYW07_000165 [Mythimna separata]|uniref:Uncharacterized protein n=1 Tax=Mythimna separata TaxID=271217 RepID=A0AAD7Z2S6_MYTSE|nr:hypothetical protein PYW07_000165 [Mythimna separata]
MDGKAKKPGEISETGVIEKTARVDYDELLSSAGEFGRYQILLFLATFPFYVFGAFSYFTQVFLTETSPNHWCMIPELQNLTVLERRNLAIPLDTESPFGYSRCLQYDANWSEVISTGVTANETWSAVPCQHGWEFNKTEFAYPTIASEMGWVCDQNSNQATAQSIFFVGSIVGGLIVGWIADRFGRIPAAVFSNMVGAIAGTATIFVNNFTEFTICALISLTFPETAQRDMPQTFDDAEELIKSQGFFDLPCTKKADKN